MITPKLSMLAALALTLAGTASLHATTTSSIAITNPDFSTDTSGYTATFSFGNGGAYSNANPTVAGSTASSTGYSGGITGLAGYPMGDTTAGYLGIDAGDVTGTPASFTSNTQNVDISSTGSGSTVRMSSNLGDQVSFYQDTGVKFAANATYTLSAYASGEGSGNGGFSDTGVGFSGNTPLTALAVENNSDLVGLGSSGDYTLKYESVTIDTRLPQYQSLIGQDIVVNLLDEAAVTYGGRGSYFTDVSLTVTAPEPSTCALLLAGFGFLFFAVRHRRSA